MNAIKKVLSNSESDKTRDSATSDTTGASRRMSSGNKGIACGLNNLQKIRDGEPLGGKASAESDFSTDDEEDFLD